MSPSFTPCTLLCGGSFAESDIEKILSVSGLLVAVDKGADILFHLQKPPHLAIGDFDSISPETKKWLIDSSVPLRAYSSDKDKTDLELALDYLCEEKYTSAILYGALGGRIDHTLGNLLLLGHPEYTDLDLTICDQNTTIRVLTPARQIAFSGRRGDTVSLIPISPHVDGLSIKGVRWELLNRTVHLGSTFTISNEFASALVTISLTEGTCLAIHISKEVA